ncbi:hypothetical protein YC2023_016335 [Brassica napus]|uniref:(rape) hypothetical protein n=1 Tax=Brassica napus TaxID=3708 RepID=A0A816K0Q2_BRANA|nr:unnamed protein product [Brassica napus]
MSLSSPHLTMKKNVSSPSSFTALESAFVDSEWTPVDVPCPSFHSSTIVYSERDKRFYVNNCNPDYTGPTDFTPTSNPGLLTPVSGYKRFPFSNFLEASSNPRFRFAFTMPRLARELDPM